MIDKVCPGCGKKPPEISFSRNRCKPDGLQTRCKECHKTYDKKYYKENTQYHKNYVRAGINRLRAIVRKYKEDKGCKYCQEKDGCCLDFHHTEDDKLFTIARIVSSGCTQLVLKEIEKCDVVCSNCHRKLHAGRIMVP